MARVSPLGPSVAPCPVEPSTVHGAALFEVESFCEKKPEFLGLFFSGPESMGYITMKMASLPATSSSDPICDPVLTSRRALTTIRRCKEILGFHLVDLSLFSGPSPKPRPITRISGLNSQLAKPRSVLSIYVLSPIQLLYRSSKLCGRGLQQRWRSTHMHWPCTSHLRTLYLLASLSSNLKKYTYIYISTARIKHFQTIFSFSNGVINRMFRCSKPLSDLVSPLHPCSSYFEKSWYNMSPLWEKSFTTSSFLERTIFSPLFTVSTPLCLVPASLEATESFSTSLCLVTVTNLPLLGLSVVVSPIYHFLACGIVFYNPCLRAMMELSSDYLSLMFIVFDFVVSNNGKIYSPKPCTKFE